MGNTSAPGTELYHAVPQASRIQKRLVLNQCFKSIAGSIGKSDALVYVTFGGEELYDVMDLVAVFDVRRHRLTVISYEQDPDVAEQSLTCPVASTLSQIETVRIRIVPTPFFDQATPLLDARPEGRFIYYLDDTKPFSSLQAAKFGDLLRMDLLKEGDFLLVTSCITPRIMHQPNYLSDNQETFKLFYGPRCQAERDFKVRNHVDLLVSLALSRHDKVVALTSGRLTRLRVSLLRKFRYRDTRAAMGLWLFEVCRATLRSVQLVDKPFEEFPVAFTHQPGLDDQIPDIFDSID
jgi:hypothetical protein